MNNIITKLASSIPSQLPNTVNSGASGDLTDTVIAIINGVIGVLGLIAVVIVIIGGVNYMTSSGDAAKVKKAKDTILYGIIGLIICVLAFAIVNFVIANLFNGGGSGGSSSSNGIESYQQNCVNQGGTWDSSISKCILE